ncbi:MAG: TrkH family potassium uptake protein, partial [Limisphaerales bacterium]
DTGSYFSTLGQWVILAMFQIGGLGIITFVAFISVFSAKALPVPQMIAFRQIINAPAMNDLKRRLTGVVLLTLLFELSGVFLLFQFFAPFETDPLNRLHWSVFHSVSAFCNAGFALQANSLEMFQSNLGINITVMSLIVLGGLGFLVIPEIIEYFHGRFRSSGWSIRRRSYKFLKPRRPHLTIQTRMSLWLTLWLILGGTLAFWLLEFRHLLAGESLGNSLLASAFQSVTTRTAGFNTVAIGDLQPATLVIMMILMVIGGSPVSTAGGIKTLTFAILLLSLRTMILQKDKVEAFGRTLPQRGLFAALSVFVLYILTAGFGFFLLALFDPQIPLRDLGFEMISALSTVGLSTGITPELSTPSKLVLCVAMFIGRVGPISLVLSVFQTRARTDYDFPDEDVIVG